MRNYRILLIALAGLFGVTSVWQNLAVGQETSRNSLGSVLKAAFEPMKTEKVNADGSKGVYTRSFWDFGGQYDGVEIAFVVDATNTMRRDLEELKAFLTDIAERVGKATGAKSVGMTFVVYRDLWEFYDLEQQIFRPREQPIEVLGARFLRPDHELEWLRMKEQLEKIHPETGDPGDQEQVDRGIHAALTQLEWSTDPRVLRLVIVGGDAPPWDQQYIDRNPNWQLQNKRVTLEMPLRGFTTEQLIEEARQRNVRIYTVACDTEKYASVSWTSHNENLQGFFHDLSAATNGRFLNLRDQDAVTQLVAELQAKRLLEVGTITQDEIDARLAELRQNQPVSVAVLPFLPLNEMDFVNMDRNGVLYAFALTDRLRSEDSREVRDMLAVEDTWKQLADRPDLNDEAALLEAVRTALDVDLLIWGVPEADGAYAIRVHHPAGVHNVSVTFDSGNPSGTLDELVTSLDDFGAADLFVASLQQSNDYELSDYDPDLQTLLARALLELRQSQRFDRQLSKDREKIHEHCNAALNHLRYVLDQTPQDPWALLLKASAHANLGEEEVFEETLTSAYENRNAAGSNEQLRKEIEADYALFVQKDPRTAVDLYEQLKADAGFSQTGLRARWMLAGIYVGDWCKGEWDSDELGLMPQERLAAAKTNIVDMLTFWPHEPEADFYRLQSRAPEGGPPKPHTIPASETTIALYMAD